MDKLTHRLATASDMPALTALMNAAIAGLLPQFLSPDEVKASFAVMGLDTQLIEDGTYFVVEINGEIAGCGGWSRRATLFGGNHTAGAMRACSIPKAKPPACAPCTHRRISPGAAWGGKFWSCARKRRAPKVFPTSNSAPPWAASRSMNPAAICLWK
jgi:hypothetical protein